MKIGLNHWGYHIAKSWSGFSEKPTFEAAEEIADTVESMFIHGEVDEVDVIFTYFKSAMVQIPKTVQLLPVQPKAREGVEVQAQEVWEEDDPTDYPTLVLNRNRPRCCPTWPDIICAARSLRR